MYLVAGKVTSSTTCAVTSNCWSLAYRSVVSAVPLKRLDRVWIEPLHSTRYCILIVWCLSSMWATPYQTELERTISPRTHNNVGKPSIPICPVGQLFEMSGWCTRMTSPLQEPYVMEFSCCLTVLQSHCFETVVSLTARHY